MAHPCIKGCVQAIIMPSDTIISDDNSINKSECFNYWSRLLPWIIQTSTCIAALAIAFNNTCIEEFTIHPDTYLKIGGFIGIIDASLTAKWSFNINNVSYTQTMTNICAILFGLSWGVVGWILFFRLPNECQHNLLAMVYAYVIITWIYAGARIMFLVQAMIVCIRGETYTEIHG